MDELAQKIIRSLDPRHETDWVVIQLLEQGYTVHRIQELLEEARQSAEDSPQPNETSTAFRIRTGLQGDRLI